MRVNPEEKSSLKYNNKEKYILREAFDTRGIPYLPEEVCGDKGSLAMEWI
jgi:hypothetical protein